jgi:hypothetical protein
VALMALLSLSTGCCRMYERWCAPKNQCCPNPCYSAPSNQCSNPCAAAASHYPAANACD